MNFAPHVLSATIAKVGFGRRRLSYRQQGMGNVTKLPWYVLFVVQSGEVQWHVQGEQAQRISAPCALLFQPGEQFSIEVPVMSEYTWIDWGIIQHPLIPRTRSQGLKYENRQLQPLATEAFGRDLPHLLPQKLFALSNTTSNLIAAEWWRGKRHKAKAHMRLAHWLMHSLEALDTADAADTATDTPAIQTDKHHEIRSLLTIAEHNLDQELNVTKWAQLTHMSRSSLERKIREEIGTSAKGFLDSLRLDKAMDLLRHSGDPIHFIARQVGMRSHATFTRWFKKHTGIAPHSWRNQL